MSGPRDSTVIRTLTGDLARDAAGFVLAHEHVYNDFADASGDPDLRFTRVDSISADLAEARAGGVRLLVEASTYDMGADPVRTASLCATAGLQAVKSTGWFRSPFLDAPLAGMPGSALSERLIADLRHGFAGTRLRAGVIGEVGLRAPVPTRAEALALDAAAAASLATGAGIIAHTDDWANAQAMVRELTARAVRHRRIMLSHCRCADPIAAQQELADAGTTIAFDQLGHPQRDAIPAVADRIVELIERGCGGQLVVSADVGRISRLRSSGGSGYLAPVRELLSGLAARGIESQIVDGLTCGAPARFLAWSPGLEGAS